MNNYILLSIPAWLIGIFVFCVLYSFCAVMRGWTWPFEKTPSWEELLRQERKRTQPQAQLQAQPQAQPQARPEPEPEPEPQPELKPEPQTDPQLIEEAIAGICYLGFKKTEAKKVVNIVCNNRVFTNAEELIKAALDRSNV